MTVVPLYLTGVSTILRGASETRWRGSSGVLPQAKRRAIGLEAAGGRKAQCLGRTTTLK